MPSRFKLFHLVCELLSSKREETLKSFVRPARLILAVLGGFALASLCQFLMTTAPDSAQAARLFQTCHPSYVIMAGYQSYTDTIHNAVVSGDPGPPCDEADLGVEKTVNDSDPQEGDTIVYAIAVTNNGPDDATGVQLIDTLPAGVTFGGYTATQGIYTNTDGLWEIGDLADSTYESLIITATVDSGTGGRTITNTAHSLTADQFDPNSGNNEATAVITVAGTATGADLAVVKVVNNSTPAPGDVITYTVIVTNNGLEDTTGVQLIDTLPAGVTFGGYTVTQGTYTNADGVWEVGDLVNTANATLTITANVDWGTSGSTITNTAHSLTSDQPDPNADNNQGSAVIVVAGTATGADLEVSKTVNDPTPAPGDVITYTVTVTNNGPYNATGVPLTDVLPAGVTFVSYSSTQGTYASTNGLWEVGSLENTANAILTTAATVENGTSGKTITNTAYSLTADQPDPNPDNNEASVAITPILKKYYIYLPIIFKRYEPCHFYDFSFPEGDWLEYYEDAHTIFGYANGEYRILARNPTRTHLAWPGRVYECYSISAKVRWFDASSVGKKYGLTFGIANDLSSFYTFMVYPNEQAYEIKHYNGSWHTLHFDHSSAITTGLASNYLSVGRLNGRIDVAVNNTPLASMTATQISGRRHVGIGVGPYERINENHEADARFDDFEICPLSEGGLSSEILSTTGLQGGSVPGDGDSKIP